MVKKSRPSKTRKPLSRESISLEALRLIDAHGLDGLSMRRLGAALGVEAMAIYHHFKNKGEVLDGVLEQLIIELDYPSLETLPPLERLRAFTRAHREMALRHPHAFILVPTRRFNTELSFGMYERVLHAFHELGFDAARSARYFRALGYYASGAGLADIASHARQPDATPVRLENFDRSEYPLVSAVAPQLRAGNLDAIFEFGLTILFDAIERDARAIREQREPR